MQQLEEGLFRLASVAESLGLPQVASEALQAAERAHKSSFNVAALGQFKRGKSSVLNALIGKPLLPTDVLPTTGVVTVISRGQEGVLAVTDVHGSSRQVPLSMLEQLITEEKNPKNEKALLQVTVPCSCALTEAGVDLVDTPGLGSIFKHSANRTREFLPRVDVALLVLGAEPPITDEELELAEEASQVASHLWVVINKADLFPPNSLARILKFTANALASKLAVPFAGPWAVSAKRALEEGHDPGMHRLREELLRLAQERRETMALASARRSLRTLTQHALTCCRVEKQALTSPLDKIEANMAAFRQQAEHASDLALALMVRTRKVFRLDLAKLEKVREAHEQNMLRAVRSLCLKLSLRAPSTRNGLDNLLKENLPAPVNAALASLAFAYFQEFQTAYNRYAQELTQAFSQLLEPIRALARQLFDVDIAELHAPPPPLAPPAPSVEGAVPSLALDWGWVRGLAFQLLPRRFRARLTMARGRQLAMEWWRQGCGKLSDRFAELVDETVRQAENAAENRRRQLEQEILATLEKARLARAQGELQVAAELSRLQHLENELHALLARASVCAFDFPRK